jgi:hypothetical protein
MISHGGGIEGFNTMLAYYPDDKLAVVVLSNVNGSAPGEIATNLAAIAHGEKVMLPSERKEITVDAATLVHYVGAYKMDQGPTMLIRLEGNQLSTHLGNQPSFPIFPESKTMFFLKVVDAQLEFSKFDAKGEPAMVTLHQAGRDMRLTRLDAADAKKAADAAAAMAKRIKDQTPYPGGEALVGRMIEDIREGHPNYDLMSPDLAKVTRDQLANLQSTIKQLGALESIKFKAVGPAGPDIYECKFAGGTAEYRIWLGADGKIESANFHTP